MGTNTAIAEYHIDYEDGSHEVITTDSSWETTAGNITKSSIYYGEDRELSGNPLLSPMQTKVFYLTDLVFH